MDDRDSWITASEVGEYVYCARAWYLRGRGYETEINRPAREAGIAWHAIQGGQVAYARHSRAASITLTVLSVLAVLLLILYLVTR